MTLPDPEDRLPDPSETPRREFLKAAVALGGSAGLSACVEAPAADPGGAADLADVPTGDPDAVPDRQHAWNEALPTDADGNVRPPRHHVLRYADLGFDPTDGDERAAARETLREALSALERAFAWSNEGLLFTVGYAPAYFDRFDASLPASVDLPAPTALTEMEDPAFDEADLLIHLASDAPAALLSADEALFGDAGAVRSGDREEQVPNLSGVLDPVDRRTGFVGAGLPREHRGVPGLPEDAPIPEEAPLMMGFRNGFRASQATEDRVTVREGPFSGATTQHVAALRLQLNAWWRQESHAQRVAKLFSPVHAAEERVGDWGEKLGADPAVADLPEDAVAYARDSGVVGHAQKAARAREDGAPLLLRRDFDTTDGDHAGVHFLTNQRRIGEFVRVRAAMTGADIADETAVGSRVNNGILQYVFVRRRGNYLLPPRRHRVLPTPTPE
ncbi:DUF7405 family protein [Haloparvum sedimenti]|uniref:DUF7405 family protein n=1 Tax=Haloparvum sedimenti TaxID=1678448 RepID=UPI00071E7EDC|nr:hypothetical protein [Haloparvum sedimenti]